MSRDKRWYLILLILCFLFGAYVWKVTHTSVKPAEHYSVANSENARDGILVFVGDEAITSKDLSFEYDLHMKEVTNAEDLKPKGTPAKDAGKKLTPLKEKLLTGMIERKILFLHINQDRSFAIDDPSRFTQCLAQWQETLKEAGPKAFSEADSERLKERLCERSIIEQYLTEKTYASIKISDDDIKKYYQEKKKDFVKPRRVLIRQIVLPTEEEAKSVLRGLTRANFGQKAKEFSTTPEAQSGGLVGPFAQGEMPRFFDLAFSMNKGEISGVLKSPYGFHIVMVEERYSKTEQTLEQARDSIRAILTKNREQEEYKKWIEIAINAIPVKTPGSKI